jgi:hypothetical protein
MIRTAFRAVALAALVTSALAPTMASAQLTAQKYRLTKGDPAGPSDTIPMDGFGPSEIVTNVGPLSLGFEGISQFDVASVGRNFIPPDTIGAAGRTQYVQFTNGGFAVYDKASGVRTSFTSDTAFWQAAGQAGVPNGDQRVLYDAKTNKFIAISFGPNTKDILVAVSNGKDALGGWKSTKFEGFAELFPGGRTLADYPTLAMDNNAIYIGTNDFAQASVGGATSFRGTTLNVIPLSDIVGKTGPNITGNVQFRTAFTGGPGDDYTRGFAIQGVNSSESTDGTGHIIAASINDFGLTRYDVLNAGTAGAVRTVTASTTIGTDYTFNGPGRQPAADAIIGNPALPNGVAANRRIIDTFGDQISSSAFEHDGKIYSVHTVTENGTDVTVVRYTVLDTATNAVLDEGSLGEAGKDYYQGSLAVNSLGQVVISYNRSGLDSADGRITLAARTFQTNAAGQLVSTGDEIVLRVSDTDDYHNGSLYGQAAAGRQRWADYSTVTLDPTSIHSFWISGTFAREYNLGIFGHPGGTGGSRWGTYIAQLTLGGVPEPQNWAMLIAGFGLIGAMSRRQRRVATVTA